MFFRKFREVCCNLNATFYDQNTMMDVYYDDNACLQVKCKSIKSIQMFSFFQVSLYCDENANTLIKVNQECEVSTATGSSVTTEGSSLPAEGKSSPTLLPSTG